MALGRCEFVDSRLRRYPPDRSSAVSYGQAGENALRFPTLPTGRRLSTRLHSTVATSRIDFDSGRGETFSRLPAFSLFFPEPVQTTETTASAQPH
jgi:hypothetical protein